MKTYKLDSPERQRPALACSPISEGLETHALLCFDPKARNHCTRPAPQMTEEAIIPLT